ncbi:MAG: diaminopimelate epimerase [Verrucomicrobia bacterium]|nr:diaminopimelate epimerase [Verrucomicrobiota bacterium]MCF7708628.1 diaminopimelate epimerase [Verrucomicrobiota bacterium]
MNIEFMKMNGAGNDFILIDNRSKELSPTPEQITRLCHRQRGIGADGVILLVPCESGKADWAWNFYNNDGSCAEMCGNGARCFAHFIRLLTDASEKISFETVAGVINAKFEGDEVVIDMTPPCEMELNQSLELSTGTAEVHSINTGVPHAIVFVEDTGKADIIRQGSEIRYHDKFAPKGTNVDFVQVLDTGLIRIRTYERGVEGETLACGTGVTASALISAEIKGLTSPVKVKTQGGDTLEVRFDKQENAYTDVRLKGPVEEVFKGNIKL